MRHAPVPLVTHPDYSHTSAGTAFADDVDHLLRPIVRELIAAGYDRYHIQVVFERMLAWVIVTEGFRASHAQDGEKMSAILWVFLGGVLGMASSIWMACHSYDRGHRDGYAQRRSDESLELPPTSTGRLYFAEGYMHRIHAATGAEALRHFVTHLDDYRAPRIGE